MGVCAGQSAVAYAGGPALCRAVLDYVKQFGPAPPAVRSSACGATGLLVSQRRFVVGFVCSVAGAVVAEHVRRRFGVVSVVGAIFDHFVDESAVGVGVAEQVIQGGVAVVVGARGCGSAW